MKRASIAVAAAAFAFPAFASGGTVAPSLRLLKLSPPSVQGVHFKSGEKVGVTLVSGKTKLVRTVHASGAGKFTVVFGSITQLQRCESATSLVAVGVLGDRTVVKLPTTGCAVTSTTTPSNGGSSGGTGGLEPPPPYTT